MKSQARLVFYSDTSSKVNFCLTRRRLENKASSTLLCSIWRQALQEVILFTPIEMPAPIQVGLCIMGGSRSLWEPPKSGLLTYKILHQGYYWSIMQQDIAKFVRMCEYCERNTIIQHRPAALLTSICAPREFLQWGIHILGPFSQASGQQKFLLVAMDYFIKWVEAEPLAHIAKLK